VETPAFREPSAPVRAAKPSSNGERRAEQVPSLRTTREPEAELLPDGYDELPPPPPFQPPVPTQRHRTEEDSLRVLADQLLKDL